MDLQLTSDQELLRDTTRAFLAREAPPVRRRELIDDATGVDAKAWKQGAELGWFSLLAGDSVSGNGLRDLCPVVAELGRSLFPGPLVETNVVAQALAHGDPTGALPGVVAGDTVATWARNGHVTVHAGAVTGVVPVVQDAQLADLLLVEAGDVQVLVPRAHPGVTVEPLERLDLTRRFATVHLDGVPGPVLDADPDELFDVAVVLQSAATVGAIDALFEATRTYALDRVAFGRPIGSFQAVKHRLAEMLGWIESAKAIVGAAADTPTAELASTAKAYVGTHAPLVARGCLQVHGGIGYTWEHDLHLYLRRVESDRALYGSPEEHLDRLAGLLGIEEQA
jgi:alkylation response protein AidB-like acyl-CoA dehydrogenase